MSLKVVSFDAKDAVPNSATDGPVPEPVFDGDNEPRLNSEVLFEDGRRRFVAEAAERRPGNPNNFPVFGGSGGGEPSGDLGGGEAWRLGGLGFPSSRERCWYFWRMKRSMQESSSSMSVGIGGLTFLGL